MKSCRINSESLKSSELFLNDCLCTFPKVSFKSSPYQNHLLTSLFYYIFLRSDFSNGSFSFISSSALI